MARSGREWPRRCARCNAADVGAPIRVSVSTVPVWVYPTLLLGVLPYVLLRMMARRDGRVRLYLCATHHIERVAWLFGTPVACVVVGVAALGLMSVTEALWLGGIPVLAIIVALAASREVVNASQIDGERLVLTGTGPAFRASLPALDAATNATFRGGAERELDLDRL